MLDDRAARREAARAHEVLAERAQRAGERSNREAMSAPKAAPSARTEGLGRDADPIVIPAGPGGLATSVVSAAERPVATAEPESPPEAVLRRVEGPHMPRVTSAIPEPHTAAAPAPVTAVTAATASSSRSDGEALLLLLMAALGVSMVGGGLRLISLRSA